MKSSIAIRLPNWLGDVIMTLPTIDALREAGYSVELLGKSWVKPLFSAYDYSIYEAPSDFWQMRYTYRQLVSKSCVLLTNSLSSVLPLIHSGIKGIAYRRNCSQLFLNKALKKQPGLHEIEYFWQLANVAVDYCLARPRAPQLLIADTYDKQALTCLKTHHVSDDFMVVCPGAVGLGNNKQSKVWPHWRALIENLLRTGKHLVACPTPSELPQFKTLLPKDVIILPHLNIPLYAAVMKQANRVIANDSGSMHLAAAVGSPVLGIFGCTDPQRTSPWGGDMLVRRDNGPI